VVWLGWCQLPSEILYWHIVRSLGKERCRVARACRGLRAAVALAKDLGAFRHRVLALAAGCSHTVVCTRDAVFSFGRSNVGQLGLGLGQRGDEATPRVVKGLLADDVVAAAASEYSTLVCTAQGRAYWFGKLIGTADWTGGLVDCSSVTIQSAVPRLLGGLELVVGVAAGLQHLLAWTGSSQLYTWGKGVFGQLGHGGKEDEAAPRLVEGLAGQQVVAAGGCRFHSVACTASGRVYTFGSGWPLGHGQNQQLTPMAVEGLAGSTVVAVAAGSTSTAAVTATGELYTWGRSNHGNLGHGEEHVEVLLPQLVAGLAGKRVAGVAAGDYYTLAWTDSGELYSWGRSGNGAMGHENVILYSPRRVEALAGEAVVGATAGSTHTIVTTQQQEVHAFGRGSEGQLGHKVTHYESTPKPVAGLNTS
jgi:alpha-tubulin suppressor-like RCC1 family protein